MGQNIKIDAYYCKTILYAYLFIFKLRGKNKLKCNS